MKRSFRLKVHIIRHTESIANTLDILAGQIDYPLSEKGKADAGRIADWYMQHYSPHTIYCSPMLRAKETAQPFLRLHAPVLIEDDRLKEQNLGIFQGKTYEELKNEPLYEHDRSKRWDWDIPQGESYRRLAERISEFFSSCTPDGRDCLIVTHAVTMRIIRGLLENTLPEYPSRIPINGEIWELDFRYIGYPHVITSLFAHDVAYNTHRA